MEDREAILALLGSLDGVSDNMQAVVNVALNSAAYGISNGHGYCQKWVADVYHAAGQNPRWSAATAMDAFGQCHIDTSLNNIPVGATVYGTSNSSAGHVGIYIGNGMVIENIGRVNIQSLSSWASYYHYVGWGFNNWTP